MKSRTRILLFLLLTSMLMLSGCLYEAVDVTTQAPDGPWQTYFVWPLAHSLIWLDELLRGYSLPYHWGFAIILFTLIIKILTFPLTLTQIRGMKAQREIQPKVQALQKKFGDDREKLAAEQMKLYKEAGVNPLSGCLPLLVQMPILFGLYQALVVLGGQIEGAQFFWIPNLGFPYYNAGLSWIADDFNAGEYLHLASYLVLPIVLVISQYSVQKWMTPAPPAGSENSQAAMTKQIGTMMTFMFGFFTLQVPAGLSLYWVTSNLLQVVQQLVIGRDTSDAESGIGGKYAVEAAANGAASQIADSGSLDDVESATQSSANSKKKANNTSNKSKSRRKKKKR